MKNFLPIQCPHKQIPTSGSKINSYTICNESCLFNPKADNMYMIEYECNNKNFVFGPFINSTSIRFHVFNSLIKLIFNFNFINFENIPFL